MTLEAYLGTCVGVTLHDKEAMVGGLAHFLLPVPTGPDYPWSPMVYAKTGMPLFIKAMCDAGAKKDRLEACVAGGALVGPVSQSDLDLDIGGRTTRSIHRILKKAKIPVNNAETGGYFCCKLTLDLKTMESSIQPLYDHTPPAKRSFKKPSPSEIEQGIKMVRPIPQVALKITRMINHRNYNLKEISQEIKQDQIISARLIKLCNSAFFGFKKNIESVDRALVVLGETSLLQLIVSASMELYFSQCAQGYSLCKGGLFQHAFGTAIVAERLSRFTGCSAPEIAYTAGLLHDIGKVVLDQHISSIYPFCYRQAQRGGRDLCETEEKKLGITHPEVGGILADNWSLPDTLADAIKYHHYPEQGSEDAGLTYLVYLADLLMSRFQVGQEIDFMNTDEFSSRMHKIGLASHQFSTVVDLISQGAFDSSFH